MKRLFLSLPDVLPENLDLLAWRLPGGQPEHGEAAGAAELPGADEIWLALPAGRVLLSDIKLSKRALRQLHGALGNALEDRLMLDPANAHIALGKTHSNDVHPVAVVEIAWLEQALALCRQQGIKAVGAIPETLLWLGEEEAGQWSARWNGHAGFVRSGPSAGFTLDDGDVETSPLALRLAVAEARRLGTLPASIALESAVDIDVAAWSRQLDCPVQPQTLRNDPHPPAINLLQGAYAPKRGGWLAGLAGHLEPGRYRLAAGLAIAALGVHVLGTIGDWARLSWENRQLRGEMNQVFKETFPQTQAIVDPTLQMQRQLADLRRARGFIEPGDFLHILNATAGQVGGVAGLNYEMRNNSGRLTLAQPAATDVEGLRAMLASQGYQVAAASGEGGDRSIVIERSRP